MLQKIDFAVRLATLALVILGCGTDTSLPQQASKAPSAPSAPGGVQESPVCGGVSTRYAASNAKYRCRTGTVTDDATTATACSQSVCCRTTTRLATVYYPSRTGTRTAGVATTTSCKHVGIATSMRNAIFQKKTRMATDDVTTATATYVHGIWSNWKRKCKHSTITLSKMF